MTVSSRVWRLVLSAAVCAGATGCHHRQPAPAPPVAPTSTVPLAQVPDSDKPPLVQTVPVPPAPLPSASVQPARVKKTKHKTTDAATATMTPPPASGIALANQVASAAPPAAAPTSAAPPPADTASVIGSLTAGGDAAPEEKQKASDAIATVEKRLAGLSAGTLDSQKEGVARVRNFLRQAHEALNSGDADGAGTLATKAGVLLDDLLK